VHSDPVKPERRPFEDALDAALDETGAVSGNTSRALDVFEVEGQCYSSTAEVPPDVRAAIEDASQALDDIFGGPPMKTHIVAPTGAAAQKTVAAATAAPAQPAPAPSTGLASTVPSVSLEDTAPMPPDVAGEIVAAAQAHSHTDLAPDASPPPETERESQISTPPPATAERPAPSRVMMASDPVPAEQPAWMQHAVAITAIAVIAVFTAAGIAIVVLH
jgi:hypothetical protein